MVTRIEKYAKLPNHNIASEILDSEHPTNAIWQEVWGSSLTKMSDKLEKYDVMMDKQESKRKSSPSPKEERYPHKLPEIKIIDSEIVLEQS